MQQTKKTGFLNRIVILSGIFTSLALTPRISFDAVNPPKFLILSIFGGISGGIVYSKRAQLLSKNYRTLNFAGVFFVAALFLTFIFSSGNKLTQFYGIHGRHTGLITYLALSLIMIAATLTTTIHTSTYVFRIICLTSFFSTFYGTIQYLGLDPFPWNRADSWIVGTFANPNFFSSFLAISNIFLFSFLLQNQLKIKSRILTSVYIIYTFFLMIKVDSTQGFLVFISGAMFISILRIKGTNKFKRMTIPLFFVGLFTLVILILDILQKVPWSPVLYKDTVSVRGDFWRAASKIIFDHPWFGVGFDGFRNWYPRYRDLKSLEHGEAESMTDAAHNVFLDFALNGGLPLFGAYMFLVSFTVYSIIRIFKRSSEYNFATVGVISSWVGYQVQSFISINHLGLAVWGWLFSGIIIGYEILTRQPLLTSAIPPETGLRNAKVNQRKRKAKTEKALAPSLIGGLVGAAISFPIFAVNVSTASALQSGNPVALIEASLQWPQDGLRMSIASDYVTLMGYPRDAYELARKAAEFDPEFSVPWKYLATFPKISEEEKRKINMKLDELDPLFREYERARIAPK